MNKGLMISAALLIGLNGCGADDSAEMGKSADYPGDYYPEPGGADYDPSTQGEKYGDYGENPWTDPAEDALATFGIDVDTASYALMRRDVTNGFLPVPQGVRTEEYVNYFDYGYEPPADDAEAPFEIHLAAAPSAFGEDLQLLRIGIKAKEAPVERGPANLVFLVDVSGSMADENKLPLVKQTLKMLVDQLDATDTIGLVTYAGSVGTALEPTPASERERIFSAIDGLASGGSTYGEGGIRAAYDLAQDAFREGGINRVILASDGDMNVGLTGDALIELIEQKRETGIFLTILGFGAGNYNDYDMERLADHGNGNYAYIDGFAEAERVVRRDLLGTLVVVAKDVKIQVSFDSATVKRYRLLGYENRDIADDDFDDDKVDTGDIGAGHDVTALIELELQPESTGDLATVDLRFKDPDGTTDRQLRRSLEVSAIATSFDEAPASLRFAAAVAEYAEILRNSSHSEGARFDDVISIATPIVGEDGDRGEFLELVGLARDLR